MTTRNLDALFHPRSIAVFGASNQPNSIGEVLMRNLLDGRFSGPIMPVNSNYNAVAGVLCYPDVAGLPKAPDLAIIATPPATVPHLISELGERGTRAAVVVTAGLNRERAQDGRLLTQVMLEAARPHVVRVLGPASIGLMVPEARLNATFLHSAFPKGNLAFVTESGELVTTMLEYAQASGVGFSHVISIGRGTDVDFADLLDYLGSDTRIPAILLYMETVGNARKFLSAARAAARRKPVLVFKAGINGDSADTGGEGGLPESFHSGVLATPDAVFDAAMRRAGVLRVDTLAALFDAVETLARTRKLTGEHLTILSNSKSAGLMAADALATGGGRLAPLAPETIDRLSEVLSDRWTRRNPVEVETDAPPDRQVAALEILLDDQTTDGLIYIHEPVANVDSRELASALIEPIKRGRLDVLACWLGRSSAVEARRGFSQSGIPTYDSPEHAVRAFLQMVAYRRSQLLLMQTPTSTPEAFVPDLDRAREVIEEALSQGRSVLTGKEAGAVLLAYGIAFDSSRIVANGRENQELDGENSHALYVGMKVDPAFGPVIIFGHGGAAVEINGDVSVTLPPLNVPLAVTFVSRTRISRLLAGFRGQPAVDQSELYLTLVKVAQLIADIAEIAEMDINPLIADKAGITAVDVRIRIYEQSCNGHERLAIKPYPQELEEEIAVNGEKVTLRPIRPEDAPQHTEFFARLTPEDVRYRFFRMLRRLAQSELSRFTQIDYDREMAFIATRNDEQGRPETLGVVRVVTDPDKLRAEFAILLRSDLKRRGLGRLLMEKMIRYCRKVGISELESQVLQENQGMRALARRVGFEERPSDDEDMVEVWLDLRTGHADPL
ncbi:MAG: GNAT family N-acetyltransferase [Hyphomicrobiales bacterium]|nr:GNAT family N-acetyltransferase [Hyphomicrobiales bacterium]